MSYDLKALRARLNMTQQELAKKLGVKQATISRFETGAQPINERTRLAVEALIMKAAA